MAKDSGKWLTAAECAARTGLTVRALRVYERAGLLKPSRGANGWRRYGPHDLIRLNTISVLKGMGLSLAQIRNLLRETDPSLLNVLRVQATSWRGRQAQATKALEVVEAAIQRLERNEPPSLEELCQLLNALQTRNTPMHDRETLMTDLMQELLSAEERWLWQAWWADHPEDVKQNARYLRERAEGYAVMLEQQKQGLRPDDPAVQDELLKQFALIAKYGVRERSVRMMDWNLEVTTKFMELGTVARERHPDNAAMPYPLVGAAFAKFYEDAMRASASTQAMEGVFTQVRQLIDAHLEPTSAPAAAVVQQLAGVCAQHGLGDPEVYIRFTPFVLRINHRPVSPQVRQALDFLLPAVRAHGHEFVQPTATPAAPALHTDFSSVDMSVVRRAFARHIGMMAGVLEPRIEAAFASVERENFLGAGPWSVLSMLRGTFMTTPDASPVHVYVDSAVSILKDKALNNGQPSLYYRLLADDLVAEGAHGVHIGAGTGYYSAILRQLVGSSGRVTAIEYEAELAQRARVNLQDTPQVEVIHGDATQTPFTPADLILVSAGVTHPVAAWLDSLKEGGQLLLPLTPDSGMGLYLGIRRRGAHFFAKVLSPVMIYPCVGARNPQSAAALAEALKRGGQYRVTRLYRGDPQPPENVWLLGEGWCLAYG
jgi:protein-L-isoaspartate(D-aspartate) O-methyltransferase